MFVGPTLPTFEAGVSPAGVTVAVATPNLRAEVTAGDRLCPKVSVVWTFACSASATLTFTTDSLAGVLVKPGQVLREGDLIGYASATTPQRIAELTRKLPEVQDELLRAEVEAELARLRLGEIRALIPGRVVRVDLAQEGNVIRVRVEVCRD